MTDDSVHSTSDHQPLVRAFGWSDMFVHADDDPRTDGGFDNDGRAMLVGFLDDRLLASSELEVSRIWRAAHGIRHSAYRRWIW